MQSINLIYVQAHHLDIQVLNSVELLNKICLLEIFVYDFNGLTCALAVAYFLKNENIVCVQII